MEEPEEFSKFIQETNSRGWQTLEKPLDEINVDIIRGPYANAKPSQVDATMIRTSWVRGRNIPYDRDAIHNYLEDACDLLQWGLNAYSWECHGNYWNCDTIASNIYIEN